MNREINSSEWNINSGDYKFSEEYVAKYNRIKKKESTVNKTVVTLFTVVASVLAFTLIYFAGNIRI